MYHREDVCFCDLYVQNIRQKDSLFRQPIVLWLAKYAMAPISLLLRS